MRVENLVAVCPEPVERIRLCRRGLTDCQPPFRLFASVFFLELCVSKNDKPHCFWAKWRGSWSGILSFL